MRSVSPLTPTDLRRAASSLPSTWFAPSPTAIHPLANLSSALGGGPRLLIKRDDTIPFGFGGNKVRKAALVAARAQADGVDTLVTAGGIQSNHARVTAAAAASLGMRAVLVVNGPPPTRDSGNLLLDRLLGADVVFVPSRDERAPTMDEIADRLRQEGRRPLVIPIGASIPLGAVGLALAVAEVADQIPAPTTIVHATSSGGTQAGIVAGCRLLGWPTRVIGISADDPAPVVQSTVAALIGGIADLLAIDRKALPGADGIEVDDRFVGDGYAIPTVAGQRAIEMVARSEGVFLDSTYTGKAMAALISYIRDQRFGPDETVLFWHTGGQVGLFGQPA